MAFEQKVNAPEDRVQNLSHTEVLLMFLLLDGFKLADCDDGKLGKE
jgi:hypothetical protein